METAILAWFAGGALACGTGDPPVTPSVEVIRPAAVETLALALEAHPLPSALAGDATLSIAALEGLGVLAGGASGAYLLGSNGFELLDASPVRAMVTVEERGILIGAARGLLFWDGALAESALTEAIDREEVGAMATRGDDLYLSTGSALWLLSAGELFAFDTLGAAPFVFASAAADDVIAGMNALRKTGDRWEIRALSEEIGAARAVPGSESRILALDGGALKQRTVDGDAVNWLPVALSTGEDDPGATDIEQLAVDPLTGAVWVAGKNIIARIDRGRVGTIARPAELGAVKTISVTGDGALWISDETMLFRFGNPGRPITWSEDIAAFSANNCERCHAPLKVGHPLNGYSLWVSDIDRIVADLEIMKMPQDGAPLVGGTVDLIRRWRDEGLRE